MESMKKLASETVILDIESKNHLQNDCGGNPLNLLIGLVGVKYLGEDRFKFFEEDNLNELKHILENAGLIIGFNLVGHNGIDYKMLQNHGFNIEPLLPKTYDIMTVLIRAFGSFKGLSLDNIAKNTFKTPKKKSKKANYRLIQCGHIEEVKSNLAHELKIIENLYLRITEGGLINFKTSWGLVDEHELPLFDGFPEIGEEVEEPYDFPMGGMRLQIKEVFDKAVKCEKCEKSWQIKSICYYGDTMSTPVLCPNCRNFLVKVRTSLFGEETRVIEKHA